MTSSNLILPCVFSCTNLLQQNRIYTGPLLRTIFRALWKTVFWVIILRLAQIKFSISFLDWLFICWEDIGMLGCVWLFSVQWCYILRCLCSLHDLPLRVSVPLASSKMSIDPASHIFYFMPYVISACILWFSPGILRLLCKMTICSVFPELYGLCWLNNHVYLFFFLRCFPVWMINTISSFEYSP